MKESSSVQKKKIKITKSPQKVAETIVTGQTHKLITTQQNITAAQNQFLSRENVNLPAYQGFYSGSFLNDKPNGQGILKSVDGRVVYQGSWQGGLRHGFGRYFYPDGSKYEGDWAQNFKQGQGVFTNSIGQKYQGNWVQNKKNGKGKLTLKNNVIMEGVWQQDELASGKIVYPSQGLYEGEIKNFCRHGMGTYFYPNGDKYKGRWEKNLKSGPGTYQFANGDIYKGNFSENVRNGSDAYYSWGNQQYEMRNAIFEGDRLIKGIASLKPGFQ